MRRAAEFGALAAILAYRVGAEGDAVGAPLNEIPLPTERWYPEAVDDVGGCHVELHGSAGGNVQLVHRRDPESRVAELPPPLMPDHLDAQRALGRVPGGRKDRPHRGHSDEHQNQGRRERPADLERGVAMNWF